MTRIFKALAVIGDAVTEDDQFVQCAIDCPEAQSEKWEVVTEKLLHLKKEGIQQCC